MVAERQRKKRMERTRVRLVDYPKDSKTPIKPVRCDTSDDLKETISNVDDDDDSVKFRLWVVEDLSREVIETLGNHYDIDPSFFREHILDYVWYNISQCSFSYPETDASI